MMRALPGAALQAPAGGTVGKHADEVVGNLLRRASAHPPLASPEEVADAARKLPPSAVTLLTIQSVRLVQ